MLRKSARFALALVLSLSLCPMAAFADDDLANPNELDGGYITTQANELPVIEAIDSSGVNITVRGSNFGATAGTATVAPGGISTGAAISSTVISWNNAEIRLSLGAAPSGVINVAVTTTDGKTAHMNKLISISEDVYEDSLAKPVDGFASDYNGTLPSSGIMKGWGEYLYYLREKPVSAGSSNFAFNSLERYGVDTGEWETLASLPEWLTYASACVWEGNLLVTGVVYDAASGAVTAEERVYMYNFELKDWVSLDSDGVPLGAGIVNLDGFLRVVGGANSGWVFSDDVYEYDTGSGLGERVASLATPAFCPQLAVNQGQIFAYSYGDTLDQYNGTAVAARHLQVVVGEDSVSIDSALPSFEPVEVPAGMPARAEAFGSIAAAIEGLMLVGPAVSDDSIGGSTDTFILDWDWESERLLPYYRTASDARVYGAAACIHNNLLYACAASAVETEHSVFRATEMMAPTVESGNYAVWRQGSSDPLTVTFTPDYSRFYDGVIVDGVELYGDTEYYVTSGSTVVDLLPSYLSTLAAGEHEMVVYFDGYEDGPGAEVQAYFTIEGPSSENDLVPPSQMQGYHRLAMTGDLLLVVPFAILGIGAIALAVYLVRRRIRNN